MDEAIEDSYTDRLERENCRLRAEVEALRQLLREARHCMSPRFTLRDSVAAAANGIDAYLAKHKGE